MSTDAKRKANAKYLKSVGEIRVRLKKEEKVQVEAFAKSKNLSVNKFIIELIKKAMEVSE